jgi:hypothetical protein
MLPSKPFAKGFDPLALIAAEQSGSQVDFDTITRTGAAKLVNPQASYDTEFFPCPPPPLDNSRTTAAELLEVGAAVLFRDVPFAEITPGAPHMSKVRHVLKGFGPDFTGPTRGDCLFRRNLSDLPGPYVSQLLIHHVPAGNFPQPQQTRLRLGSYGATADTHAAIVAGNVPTPQELSIAPSYVYSPRALASYVHQDPPFLLPLQAAMILGAKVPRSTRFPMRRNESAFVSYGGVADLHCALAEVTRLSLAAAWDVKWRRFMRRRPEELWPDTGSLHPDFLSIGQPIVGAFGPYLPLVYAEGCPVHPDYPSGHAVIGGATATILKAWFADGDWSALTDTSVVHSPDGLSLERWQQPANTPPQGPVTVHGEINKLASNMGWGRNFAGIHLRSSADDGMALGETVAIRFLQQARASSHERLGNVTFRMFDGTLITI